MTIKVKELMDILSKYGGEYILDIPVDIIVQTSIFKKDTINDTFILTEEARDILLWDMEGGKNWYKIVDFVDTLLKVWNPYNPISTLKHSKLNNTTLSKALYSTLLKTTGVRTNVDGIIDRIIVLNLEFLQRKYDTRSN